MRAEVVGRAKRSGGRPGSSDPLTVRVEELAFASDVTGEANSRRSTVGFLALL
jgi:hypothetical protein